MINESPRKQSPLPDFEREAVVCNTIDIGFGEMVVGLAVQDVHGTVFFTYAQDEPIARRWRCEVITDSREEIERFGQTINEAALHVLNVLRGLE